MNEMDFRVTSNDGTTIAYDRKGSGPAVVLVGGALDDGAENAPLVPALAEHFTVYNYARRGRGASGFTGALVMTFAAYLLARLPSTMPVYAVFLPGFWLRPEWLIHLPRPSELSVLTQLLTPEAPPP